MMVLTRSSLFPLFHYTSSPHPRHNPPGGRNRFCCLYGLYGRPSLDKTPRRTISS